MIKNKKTKAKTKDEIIAEQVEALYKLREEFREFKCRAFEDWVGNHVGAVGVDSGSILVADPCYIEGHGFGSKEYAAACEATLGENNKPMFGFIPLPNIGPGAYAFATSTNSGDGAAAIYVKLDAGGRRPKRITIVLP